MFTSPNQRRVTVIKEQVEKGTGAKRPYLVAYRDNIEKAAQDLTGTAFKVYIYFLSNQEGFEFGYSPQDVANKYGCSADAARDAFNTLVKKGYLVEERHNVFTFNEKKVPASIALPSTFGDNLIKKRFHDEYGNTYDWTFKELLEIGCDGNMETAKELWEGTK